MPKNLVIVESPAKARTIRKYLGSGYAVKASLGHVKDLPKSKMGVAVDADFTPEYRVIPGKRKVLTELKQAAKGADHVYLALDPDREGEAIAWHIKEELEGTAKDIKRVMFNEITKKGVTEGISHPLPINQRRYESQQARRILDRLVGYEISPVLWKKVRRGLSAGRVQSVALRLVVEREDEIARFVPEEYWNIAATLRGPEPPDFVAKYYGEGGKKQKVGDGETAARIRDELRAATFEVAEVVEKERRRKPLPPFITSRLQQEMARRYRFTSKRTMTVAQQLYEGVELGPEGSVGLITYMRTDSVRLADDAVAAARDYIAATYGAEYLPPKPNVYKTKKSAQDAHEAIRPTSLAHPPEKVAKYLTRDQLKLYKVVWERFIACQMKPARYHQTTVRITAGSHELRAAGSRLVFPGWLAALEDAAAAREESGRNGESGGDDTGAELPALRPGMSLSLVDPGVTAEQKFTQPPPRFTEGTLIRELEEKGIGRPSTYATIVSTILERKYVEKEDGKLKPSELGRIVAERLVDHFPRIMDVAFTAKMEAELDEVEEGSRNWVDVLREFYDPLRTEVLSALRNMEDMRSMTKETDQVCDQCGAKMVERWGRNGRFLACSAYPKCKNTKEVAEDAGPPLPTLDEEIACDQCGSPMVPKRGRFGVFLACSAYPKCKSTRPLPSGIACPAPGCDGELLERRTKRGKVFYGCSNYAKTGCNFVVWGQPVKTACPDCGAPFLVVAGKRQNGRLLKCVREGCGYSVVEKGSETGT